MSAYGNIVPIHPRREIRAGKLILDCSGPIHGKWIEKAVFEKHAKVMLYRSDFRSDEITTLPTHESFSVVSGELRSVLARLKSGISLIVDDLGSLHFHEQPLDLLKQYYDALAPDGEAWIRFPNTFWVFLEDSHRVSLSEYLTLKFPLVAKRLLPSEIDPVLREGISSADGWMLIRKDRLFPRLFFQLLPRSNGGTSSGPDRPHACYLEFIEKKAA